MPILKRQSHYCPIILRSSFDHPSFILRLEVGGLDTPRSRFLKSFELFWNEWVSKHDNMKLIVCGSATTWMTNKLLGNKDGLHNRVTMPIYLRPFNLADTNAPRPATDILTRNNS